MSLSIHCVVPTKQLIVFTVFFSSDSLKIIKYNNQPLQPVHVIKNTTCEGKAFCINNDDQNKNILANFDWDIDL